MKYTKLMSIVLAAVLLLGLAVPAMAADDFEIENGVLKKYNGSEKSIVIPSGVVRIANNTIYGGVDAIYIPKTIQTVDEYAFSASPKDIYYEGSEEQWGAICQRIERSPGGRIFVSNVPFSENGLPTALKKSSIHYNSTPADMTTAGQSGFDINSSGVLISYNGPGGDVVIPESVKSFSEAVFRGNTKITSITIPSGVKRIAEGSFSKCTNLVSITLPEGLEYLGVGTFMDCSKLENTNIPSGITSISQSMFQNCRSLKRIKLPNGFNSIGMRSFDGCSGLECVEIPATLKYIDFDAFRGCSKLTDFYYGGTKEQWDAIVINNPYGEVLEQTHGTIAEYRAAEKKDSEITRLLNVTVHYNSTMPAQSEQPTPTITSFTDVPATAYYAEAVKWAVDKGITNGTGVNTFSPDTTCNTAQILTFLWRACGSPKANAANSFTDVAGNAYYYDAAQWAKAQGMVSGSTLSPDAPCTRASTVMFIWQAAGRPGAGSAATFTDVPANADYAAAVAWAVENGVTTGTGADTFSPDATCTRGQIVTFLYRAAAVK